MRALMLPVIALALAGCGRLDVNGYHATGGPKSGTIMLMTPAGPRPVPVPERRPMFEPRAEAAVRAAAARHGISPELAVAVMQVESGGRCHVRGGGARGVMQVLPRTARGVGVHGDLMDCATGAEAGARYLAHTLDAHCAPGQPGSLRQACCTGVSAYNHGAAIRRCTGYGRKVLKLAGRV